MTRRGGHLAEFMSAFFAALSTAFGAFLELARGWAASAVAWLEDDRPDAPFLARCGRGLISVDARDRVFMLAGQAFISFVPLIIVIATLAPVGDSSSIANTIIDTFSLNATTATDVRTLFNRPPGSAGSVGLVSIAFLFVAVNSFGRTLRRTFERTWGLPSERGYRRSLDGMLAVLMLVAVGTGLGVLSNRLGGGPIAIAIDVVGGAIGWMLLLWLLLSRRIETRLMVPGAIFAGIAHTVAGWAAAIYLPTAITHNVTRYGVIGVAFSLAAWLIILATTIVVIALVSAELAREVDRRQPSRRDATDASSD